MDNNLSTIRDVDVKGKTVFLRLDLDVPLAKLKTENSKPETIIDDDTRLKAGLPTINYLLENGAKVIIAGHLGRPEKKYPISNDEIESSLEIVTGWLQKQLTINKKQLTKEKIGNFNGWKLNDNLSILENLRFYESEEKNDLEFAKKLSSLAEIYVNDAFAVCHRAHASIIGVPKFLPHFAGLHLEKEIEVLSKVLENPIRPLIVIIGGAKMETKLPLVRKMNNIADYILVGGLIAKEACLLQAEKRKAEIIVAGLNGNETDITQESVERFVEIIKKAKTIVWNGPVGKINDGSIGNPPSLANVPARGPVAGFPPASAPSHIRSATTSVRAVGSLSTRATPPVGTKNADTEKGTREMAKAIINSHAYKIVGGGDTIEFLDKEGLVKDFDFVSTGGGAMLSFLSGEKLPGLEALKL